MVCYGCSSLGNVFCKSQEGKGTVESTGRGCPRGERSRVGARPGRAAYEPPTAAMPNIPAAFKADDILIRYENPQLLSQKEQYVVRKGLSRRNDAEADDGAEENSAALKIEVLNSITPPR